MSDYPSVAIVVLIALPLVAAAVLAGVGRWISRGVADTATAAVATLSLVLALTLLWEHSATRQVAWMGGYDPHDRSSVGVALVADRSADVMVVLASVLVLAAVVYSWSYLEDVHASEHTLVLVFLAGMTGFAFAADLFNAFVWFELMSVAAFAMTGLRVEEPRSVHGALTFGAMTSWAATVSLIGIALLYAVTGELNMAAVGSELREQGSSSVVGVACALVMVGYLVKAAAVPWHFWTADAEAVAPTPVCALLSGAMVALGVYGIARAWWTMFADVVDADTVKVLLLGLGCLTALVGAVMCTTQRHVKRLLAYSTISHVGIMLIAVGLLGPEGLAAAGLYVVGHGCVKAALFFGTGVLLNRFGTVDEHALYGRGTDMPLTRLTFVIGALGLAGFPASGVWLGKSVLEHTTVSEPAWLSTSLLAVFLVVSACTAGSVLRVTLRVFWAAGPELGDVDEGDQEAPETTSVLRRAPMRMVGPAWALLACSVAWCVIPGVSLAAAEGAESFADPAGYATNVLDPAAAVTPVTATAESSWTVSAVGFGLLATGLAVGLASAWVWGGALGERWAGSRRLMSRPVAALHAVHSGHLGDYIAWAMLGAAVVGLVLLS
jgi:multicomponent Na+:H+ antiporter subunit D